MSTGKRQTGDWGLGVGGWGFEARDGGRGFSLDESVVTLGLPSTSLGPGKPRPPAPASGHPSGFWLLASGFSPQPPAPSPQSPIVISHPMIAFSPAAFAALWKRGAP